MNVFIPILAAVLQAGSATLDKVILSVRGLTFKHYSAVSFPLYFLITFVIFLIFRPPLSIQFFSGNLWLFILISILMIAVTNLFYYRALDHDGLGEMQTLELLSAIPIIIASSIIFADERKFVVLIPALIASSVVVWSHWEHHHFKIAKKTLPFLVWALFAAPIGASISKLLLVVWDPISLELVRTGGVALIIWPLFFKYTNKINLRSFIYLILTNFLSAVAWILFYFSYQRSGIVYTVLLFSIQPLLVYFASIFLLKEPVNLKKVVAFGVVLVSIAAAELLS